jgi:hypothetical protein
MIKSLSMEQQIRQNAVVGAVFLDGKLPGWFQRVADHKLNIRSCADCVLGQLYGGQDTSFYAAMDQLKLRNADGNPAGSVWTLGFGMPSVLREKMGNMGLQDGELWEVLLNWSYEILADKWTIEIKNRLKDSEVPLEDAGVQVQGQDQVGSGAVAVGA